MGLTYNRFHVTAVCSPTRAALLTGRNHHRVGMGGIAEFPGPFPGYTGTRPRSCTALPQDPQGERVHHGRLRQVAHDAGPRDGSRGAVRALAAGLGLRPLVGVPDRGGRPVRPDHHPGQLGRRRARGQGREALLLPGRHHGQVGRVAPRRPGPRSPTSRGSCTTRPARRTPRTTSPGSGPTGTRASSTTAGTPTASGPSSARSSSGSSRRTPSSRRGPDPYPAWDTLSDAEKKLYARQMEVFAGFSENADWNVGRLIDAVEEMGELDNTLVIYIWGDNGASMEGTITGSFNETTFFNGARARRRAAAGADREVRRPRGPRRLPQRPALRRGLGARPEHAVPVGQADGEPPRRRPRPDGHRVAGPHHEPAGDLRTQFTHCIDVAPTILDLVGIPEPTVVDGIEQEPMDGTPFSYTLDDPGAAERHTVQYFEMYGSRAIYKDGWWACARLDKLPWDFSPATLARFKPGSGYDPDQDAWELYYLPDDFSPGPRPRGRAAREARRAAGAVLAGGRAQPRAAAARRHGRVLRHPAADADGHPLHVRGRRPERLDHGDPADLRAVVRHRGRHPRARGRRRGRPVRLRRLHRRVRAVGGRARPPDPHVPVPGRGDLQAGVDRADPDRRRPGEDAVRDRRAEAGLRAATSRCGPTDSRSARAASTTPARCCSRPTPAWTWVATTAASWTTPTRTRRRTRSPARCGTSSSTSSP